MRYLCWISGAPHIQPPCRRSRTSRGRQRRCQLWGFDGTIYNWIIPDGYYSVKKLEIWLQTQFLMNNLYLQMAVIHRIIFCLV